MAKEQTKNIQVNKEALGKFLAERFNVDIIELCDAITEFKSITSKSTKTPGEWSSTSAKKLAAEHNLIAEDFPETERTGRTLKNGKVQIGIDDVRNKLPEVKDALGEKAFSSKGVYEKALEHNLSPSDFNTHGKIKMADVKARIEATA